MAAEHVIELAPEDAPCATCGASIVEGTPRFVEVYSSDEGKQARSLRYARSRQRQVDADSDDRPSPYDGAVAADVAARFHHLDCAAKAMPYRLQPTLRRSALPAAERERLLQLIADTIDRASRVVDPAAEDPETRDEYAAFIARARDNDDALVVFGDWLQTCGDPRGQLIAVQYALETATGFERSKLVAAEAKLFAAHKWKLLPAKDASAFTWRRGFVHRVALDRAGSASELWAHPSMQLVHEVVNGAAASIPPQVSKRLVMLGLLYPHRLVDDLDPAAWPALRHLSLDSARLDAVLVELVTLPICEQLRRLELHGDVSAAGLETLRGKVSLELLDLRGTEIDEPPAELAARVELRPPPVKTKRPTGPWRVRHTKRPEWGEGRVIEETEQGIEVEFEGAGRKLIKSPALLEDVE